MNKYYITTPIYYPSANFHIGHCYTTIIADSIARYKRLCGYDVFFQTGTDEHGQKIQLKAEAAGITPKQHVDNISDSIKETYKLVNVEYDYFIYEDDEIIAADLSTYDDKEEAIEFIKTFH